MVNTIKITDEQLAKLGLSANAKAEDVIAAFENKATTIKKQEDFATESLGTITTKLEALGSQIAKLEAREAKVSDADKQAIEQKAIEAAKQSASAEATSQFVKLTGQLGGKPAGQTVTPPDVTAPKADANQPADPKAKWDADANIRAEFDNDFKVYEAYCKAEAAGSFRIQGK